MDRETPQGPTAEARRHGDYTQGDSGRWAVWTNRRPNMLGQLFGVGSITKRQCAAGLLFLETYTVVWGSSSNRDPLDMGPRGGIVHETAERADYMAKARARLFTIQQRIGFKAYTTIIDVCIFGLALGRDQGRNRPIYAAFRNGLDQCAVIYGVEE